MNGPFAIEGAKRWGIGVLLTATVAAGCGKGRRGQPGVESADGPVAGGSASPGSNKTEDRVLDRKSLAAKVRTVDKSVADDIAAPDASVDVVPTPFFAGAHVYRVTRLLPERPVVFTIGVAGDYVAWLPARPNAFLDLTKHARVVLDTAEKRKAYVVTFFETTRSFGIRFQLLRSIDELEARPGLDPAGQARFGDIRKKYASIVKPLELTNAPPYRGSAFAVKDQALVRYDVELAANGDLRTNETQLEADLPIPWAR